MRFLLLAIACFGLAVSLGASSNSAISSKAILDDGLPRQLSEFGFFDGAADRPAAALIGYSLRNPLFYRLCREAALYIFARKLPPRRLARRQGKFPGRQRAYQKLRLS